MKATTASSAKGKLLGRNRDETERFYRQYLERMRNEEKTIESISIEKSKAKFLNALAEKLLSVYNRYEIEKEKAPNKRCS